MEFSFNHRLRINRLESLRLWKINLNNLTAIRPIPPLSLRD